MKKTFDNYKKMNVPFGILKGLTLYNVFKNEDEQIVFQTTENRLFNMHHDQGCCEFVTVEEIIGDLKDLIGCVILDAREEVSPDTEQSLPSYMVDCASTTWTFYLLSTIKGSVTIRWIGGSNGYYSETVDFEEILEHPLDDF